MTPVRISVRIPTIVFPVTTAWMYGKRHSSAYDVAVEGEVVTSPVRLSVVVKPLIARAGLCPGAILRPPVPIGSKIVMDAFASLPPLVHVSVKRLDTPGSDVRRPPPSIVHVAG
jgi:hypothetical protein